MLKRPSVCSEAGSSAFLRFPSPVKLSRPQKRRRRLQLLGIHKASASGHKEGIAEVPRETFAKTEVRECLQNLNIEMQYPLQSLERKNDQILKIMS